MGAALDFRMRLCNIAAVPFLRAGVAKGSSQCTFVFIRSGNLVIAQQ